MAEINKPSKDDQMKGSCMLSLVYDNKTRAYNETAGFHAKSYNPASAHAYFNSNRAKQMMEVAKIEFDQILETHLPEFAKKKGLFYPSERSIADANARMEILKKNIENGNRSKDDIITELNVLLDSATELNEKTFLYKLLVDVAGMKKSDDQTDQSCVVVLPQKNNLVLFGYELHIDPEKKTRFLEELKKAGIEV